MILQKSLISKAIFSITLLIFGVSCRLGQFMPSTQEIIEDNSSEQSSLSDGITVDYPPLQNSIVSSKVLVSVSGCTPGDILDINREDRSYGSMACESDSTASKMVELEDDIEGEQTIQVTSQQSGQIVAIIAVVVSKNLSPFEQAKSVMVDSCMACHAPGSGRDFVISKDATPQSLVGSGMIDPNNITDSLLLKRTMFLGDDFGANMPLADEKFNLAQAQIIGAWVSSMKSASAPKVCVPKQVTVLNCQGEIPNSVSATKQKICDSEGYGYSYTSCQVAANGCASGFNLSNNLCVPNMTTPPVVVTPPPSGGGGMKPDNGNSGPTPEEVYAKAQTVLNNQCIVCHTGWKSFTQYSQWQTLKNKKGDDYFDMNDLANSFFIQKLKGSGTSIASMPVASTKTIGTYDQVTDFNILKDWVLGMKKKPVIIGDVVEDPNVKLNGANFTELGLAASITCNKPITVQLKGLDESYATNFSEFTSVKVRDKVVSSQTGHSSVGSNNLLSLRGEGIDIWDTKISFNGLRKIIPNGALNISLEVQGVTNVSHDYAKVGLLVSSTDDLSGNLAFIHWGAISGISLDYGTGKLSGFNKIVSNPNSSNYAPAPARLSAKFENGKLKVGGCFNCDNPSLVDSPLNFTPKSVYIAASSHTTSYIDTKITMKDFGSANADQGLLYAQNFTCSGGTVNVSIPASQTGAAEELVLAIVANSTLVANELISRTFSSQASCEMRDELLPRGLRRLSETQIIDSINFLFPNAIASTESFGLEDPTNIIGMDNLSDSLGINSVSIDRLFTKMTKIVTSIVTTRTEFKNCAAQSSSTCVGSLIDKYAQKILRKSSSEVAEDTNSLKAEFTNFPNNTDRLKFAFVSLFLDDDFLFRRELGTLKNGVYQLNNFEIISQLSYSIWNTGPDDTLISFANSSSPITSATLQAQVTRMLADSKANKTLVDLYDNLLKNYQVLTKEKGNNLPINDQIRASLYSSSRKFISDNLASKTKFMDIFKGNKYYVSQATKDIFRAPASISASGDTLITTSYDERHSILNHPAFLTVHAQPISSGIVKRGVFTLEQLLCYEMPAPPANVMPIPPPDNVIPDTTSTRDLLKITHSSQASCVGCHQYIDPAGFGFENFDTLGTFRTSEKGGIPIDSSGNLSNIAEKTLSFSNGSEYITQLLSTETMKNCVSKRFLEYYTGVPTHGHSCESDKYASKLANSGDTVAGLLSNLVQLESFTKRKVKTGK